MSTDETPRAGEPAPELAARLAESKALAAPPPRKGDILLGADTLVVLEGQSLGKPDDRRMALEMLQRLRAREHQVVSAVAMLTNTDRYVETMRTRVRMRDYSDADIARYVESGRSLDKAGAYAIQDEKFAPVAKIEGCYLNVVGLPLCAVTRGLRALGFATDAESLDPPCRLCFAGKAALTAAEQ